MLWSAWSLEAKLVAVVGCAVVIAISLLIVVCLIIPDTWWTCPWTADRGNAVDGSTVHLKDFHCIQSDVIQTVCSAEDQYSQIEWIKPRLSRAELCYDSSGYSLDSGRPGSTRESSSNGSSVVSEAGLSSSSSRSGSLTTLPSTVDEPSRPQIHLTLQTAVVRSDSNETVNNNSLDHLLIVTIENATDLPSRSYVETVDPSVSIRLERRSSHVRLGSLMGALIGGSSGGRRNSGQHQSLLAEDSTCPAVYHSRHPRFHHPVTMAVPKSTLLKDCQLVVKVEDKDKLVGKSELGQCRIDLRELDLLAGWLDGNESQSTVRLSRFLDVTKPDERGAILVGLSFLPTSQRITVHITQCNRLIKTATENGAMKAVVRLFVLNESGRVLKKRKTAPFDYPNSGGGRIELNELFHLDVEIERWDRCAILLVLSRIIDTQHRERSSQQPNGLNDQPVRSPPVYHHSGHVALGKRVTGHAERIHWNSSFQNPRRVISQWHSLH